MAWAAVSYKTGLALQVSQWTFYRRSLADVCRHEAMHTAALLQVVLVRAYRAAAIGRTRWQRLEWIPNLCSVSAVATGCLINRKQLALPAFEVPDLPYL